MNFEREQRRYSNVDRNTISFRWHKLFSDRIYMKVFSLLFHYRLIIMIWAEPDGTLILRPPVDRFRSLYCIVSTLRVVEQQL